MGMHWILHAKWNFICINWNGLKYFNWFLKCYKKYTNMSYFSTRWGIKWKREKYILKVHIKFDIIVTEYTSKIGKTNTYEKKATANICRTHQMHRGILQILHMYLFVESYSNFRGWAGIFFLFYWCVVFSECLKKQQLRWKWRLLPASSGIGVNSCEFVALVGVWDGGFGFFTVSELDQCENLIY